MFPSGCVFLRIQGITTYGAFVLCMKKALLSGPAHLADRLKNMLASPQFNSLLSNSDDDHLRELEELLTNFLAPLKLLLVIDHTDDIILSSNSDETAEFRLFLSHLFERCRNLKILMTSTELIGEIDLCVNKLLLY